VVPEGVLAQYSVGPVVDAVEWGGTAGRTLRLSTRDGVYLLRRRGPRSSSPGRIAFDHGLRRLLLERGIPTAAPLLTRDGQSWIDRADGAYELYPFVHGRPHQPGSRAEIGSLARTLAAFHRASAEYRLVAGPSPLLEQFSLAAPGTPASRRIDDPACLLLAIRQLAADLQRAELQAARRMTELAEEVGERFGGSTYGSMDRYVIHGDLHPANVLFDDRGTVAGLFDLDWATDAPRMRDLADALHFFASRPTVEGSGIWALTAPRRPERELVRTLLSLYHAELPLREEEIETIRWAWLGRWLAMHADGAYKVAPAERGRFLTAGVTDMAEEILAFGWSTPTGSPV
jgi:Ser/Thr protein kinase RdoA (MazF antagonist)